MESIITIQFILAPASVRGNNEPSKATESPAADPAGVGISAPVAGKEALVFPEKNIHDVGKIKF